MASTATITINAIDTVGIKPTLVKAKPTDTMSGLTEQIRSKMSLPGRDGEGRPMPYDLRHEGEGRGLNPSQIVGESLQEGDTVRIQPKISAGAIHHS